MKIEIDVDDVLADTDGFYEPYVKHIIPDFTEEKYIMRWNIQNIKDDYPEAYEIIKGLWTNEEFLLNVPRTKNAVKGLKILGKMENVSIDIHTHILSSDEAVAARYKWIRQIQKDALIDCNIIIDSGKHKQTIDADIIIEDNIDNINKSSAKYKFLVRRCHNRDYDINDIKDTYNLKGKYIVNSFYDACKIIKTI